MNRQTNMSDGNQRPEPEASSSASPVPPRDSDGRLSSPDERAQAPPTNQSNPGGDQLIAKLKQGLEKTRLPADLREQILAQLPPAEERERLFREMQEKGGMSFDQFMESLGLEVHPKP